MNLIESIKVAINAIWVNKMRSLLTMLGIIIGVSSVIAVVALGQGSQAVIGQEFEQLGVKRVFIATNWNEDLTNKDYLNHADVDAIRRAFQKEISALSPQSQVSGKIVIKRETINVSLIGVNEEYDRIEKINLVQGRYLIDSDIKANREVAVIDEATAIKIFGRRNVLGEKIMIQLRNRTFTPVIVGIYETPKGIFSNIPGMEIPSNIFIPISTMEKILGLGDRVYGIELNISEDADVQNTVDNIIRLLERRNENAGENKYIGYTAESQLEIANRVTGILTAVVGAIAAISLFVGGIGVMNIMMVSVTERTREIGIRKAIGATHRDILIQFLVEAVIISGIGGIIGTILGIVLSSLAAILIKIPPTISIGTILIAWLFSAGVGIFFGIYPANKAAKLDPIDALRYE